MLTAKQERFSLVCFLFGHKYFLIKKITQTTRKISCHRCGKVFGMNDDARCVLKWDRELEDCMKRIERFS